MTADEELDLQRWIESRRRNFPTKVRLEEKAKDQEKRQDLGIKGIDQCEDNTPSK